MVSEDGESEENRLVIPDSVREIGAFAFYGCVYTYTDRATAQQMTGGMDYLVIGSGVSLIGEQAFSRYDDAPRRGARFVGDRYRRQGVLQMHLACRSGF